MGILTNTLAQRGNSCVNIIYENVFKDKVAKLAL
jgi:hypothetical protein